MILLGKGGGAGLMEKTAFVFLSEFVFDPNPDSDPDPDLDLDEHVACPGTRFYC